MQSILNRLSDVGFTATEKDVAEYLSQKGLEEKQVTDEVLFDMLQELEVKSKGVKPVKTAALPQAKQTEQKQPAKQSSQLATTGGKKARVATESVEKANQEQAEAAATLAMAGAIAQTEFINAVQEKANELRSQVFTPEKIETAAKMLVDQQNAAIDQVMDFLSRTTAEVTRQTISEIREASGVEILDAEMVV